MHIKVLLSVFCILQTTFKLCHGGFLSHGSYLAAPFGIGVSGNTNGGGGGGGGGAGSNNNQQQQQQQSQPFNGAVLNAYRYEHPAPTSSIYRQQIVNSVPVPYAGNYGANTQYYNYGNGNRPGSSSYGQGTNSNNGNYGY